MSKNNFDIEHFPTNPTALRMMSRISPIYDRSYVGKWIFEVMGMDMDEVRLRFEELRAQAFPETATWGLIYWEQRYGLPIGEGLDYETRRRPILAHRRSHAPLNPKRMEAILSALTGREVVITENVADYTFRVQVKPGDSGFDVSELMRKIKKIKPSHQAYNLQVEFRTTKLRTAAYTETKQTVEIWPSTAVAVGLAPARIMTAGAVQQQATVAVHPGTVERVNTTAEARIGAGARTIASAQVWPGTVERAEGTAQTATGAAAQQAVTAQVWPGTAQQAEATAEAHTAARTRQQTIMRVWPGALERVETKAGSSGVVIETHQTIEIWP